MDETTYIRDRLDNQIDWYDRKSQWNQKWYKRIKNTEMIFSAAIPILIAFWSDYFFVKVIVGCLGGSITIFAGVNGLYNFHENWIQYRATTENLRKEKFTYVTKSGTYADIDDPFQELVSRCETIISHENISWVQLNRGNKKDAPSSKARRQTTTGRSSR